MTKSKYIKHRYTEEEKRIMREMYPTNNTKDIAKILGIPLKRCYYIAQSMGLKKDEKYLMESKRENGCIQIQNLKRYQFPKGHTPVNKGTKMSEEFKEKVKRTWFKKGNIPHNTRYDGAETIRTDKAGRKYTFIRVAKSKWVLKHVYLWEQAHGKVPKGYNICFKDGDTMNLSLDNMEMISNAELMKRNSYHTNYPEEVCQLIHLKGVFHRHLNKHQREK